jgi:L-2-hydroxyglutarate oxidase LhgO
MHGDYPRGYPVSTLEASRRAILAKGNYFTLTGARAPFCIYPVPEAGGLGIHLTLDLAGQLTYSRQLLD